MSKRTRKSVSSLFSSPASARSAPTAQCFAGRSAGAGRSVAVDVLVLMVAGRAAPTEAVPKTNRGA